MIVELPHVIQRHERGMSLFFLPGVDRIRIFHPTGSGIDGIESIHRPQSCYVAVTEVGDSKQCQRMISRVKDAPTVELELLAVLQSVQKSVAERALHRNP